MKKFVFEKSILAHVFLGIVNFLLVPYMAFGQGSVTSGGTSGLQNPTSYSTIMDFVQAILQVVLKIGIPVAAMFIIYSGFLFVKAQGNEQELTEAKKAFTYAVIGTAILLGSWLLAQGIASTINSLK